MTRRQILLALIPCFAITLAFGFLSDGCYHDDDLTHFLMARWAYWFPGYLLNIWGRPGLTVPLAAVSWIGDSQFGWHLARMLSALATAAAAYLAARLATRLEVRPAWLVVLLCYAQPLNALLACTTLTENFAALYLVAAVSLLQDRRRLLASIVFSLVLVTRHETAVLLPLWWLALARDGGPWFSRLTAGTAALTAPVIHNVGFRLLYSEWPLRIFFEPNGSTEYRAASILNYIPHALSAVPPALAALAIIGGVMLLRRRQFVIPAMAGLFFLAHVAVRAKGVYASGGYGRFMVTVAPLIAILATAGLHDLRVRLHEGHATGLHWLGLAVIWPLGLLALEIERQAERIPIRDVRLMPAACITVALFVACLAAAWLWSRRDRAAPTVKIAAALLAISVIVQWGLMVHPLRLAPSPRQAQNMVSWLRLSALDRAPLFATDPWITYFLNLVENPRAYKGAQLLASMPVGTIYIWDSVYSPSDYHRLPLEQYRDDPAYLLLTIANQRPEGKEMYVFQKVRETPIPPDTRPPYPPNLAAVEPPLRGIYYVRPAEN